MMTSTSAQFRRIRKAARLSQALLGARVGASRQLISLIEQGRELREGEFRAFASILRVAPERFILGIPDIDPKDVAALFRSTGPLDLNQHDLWELHDLLL